MDSFVLVIVTGAPRARIAPLNSSQVAAFVAGKLDARPTAALLDLCRVAAGSTKALTELLAGLHEEGLVKVDSGWAILTTVRLPRRTGKGLERQLSILTPQARHLLQAATTMPARFPLARLSRVLQKTPVALLPALDEALASGLLDGESELLSFPHDLVRELVAGTMPAPLVAALRPARPRATPDWSGLSTREREIAELAARGLTNGQIANRLSRSPHTVNYHLRQIFRKLGIASRVELASLTRESPG